MSDQKKTRVEDGLTEDIKELITQALSEQGVEVTTIPVNIKVPTALLKAFNRMAHVMPVEEALSELASDGIEFQLRNILGIASSIVEEDSPEDDEELIQQDLQNLMTSLQEIQKFSSKLEDLDKLAKMMANNVGTKNNSK